MSKKRKNEETDHLENNVQNEESNEIKIKTISFYEFLSSLENINTHLRSAYIRKFSHLENKSLEDWNKLIRI